MPPGIFSVQRKPAPCAEKHNARIFPGHVAGLRKSYAGQNLYFMTGSCKKVMQQLNNFQPNLPASDRRQKENLLMRVAGRV